MKLVVIYLMSLFGSLTAKVDTQVSKNFARIVFDYGYMCAQLTQEVSKNEGIQLSESKLQFIESVFAYEQEIQQVGKLLHAADDEKAIDHFARYVVNICKKSDIKGSRFFPIPHVISFTDLVDTKLKIITNAVDGIKGYAQSLYRKPLHKRMAHALFYNYVTTHIVPDSIRYIVTPYYTIRGSLRLLQRFPLKSFIDWLVDDYDFRDRDGFFTVQPWTEAVAPVVIGTQVAKGIQGVQEEEFLKRYEQFERDRYKQHQRKSITVIRASTFVDDAQEVCMPFIKECATGLCDAAAWWKSYTPGIHGILVTGGQEAQRKTFGQKVAEYASAARIEVSFLELSNAYRVQEIASMAEKEAQCHENRACVIAIEHIDSIDAGSKAELNLLQVLHRANRYSNICIVATAARSANVPEAVLSAMKVFELPS